MPDECRRRYCVFGVGRVALGNGPNDSRRRRVKLAKLMERLNTKQFLCITTGHSLNAFCFERLDAGQMAERIGFRHIIRIIGTDEHVVSTKYVDQSDKLMRREDDTVDEHFPQIMARWMRQPGATRLRACTRHGRRA